jgi:hypothetical protein
MRKKTEREEMFFKKCVISFLQIAVPVQQLIDKRNLQRLLSEKLAEIPLFFLFEGKAISAAEAFFGMGTMFGPSIGGALYEYGGFSLPFWISGIFPTYVSSLLPGPSSLPT